MRHRVAQPKTRLENAIPAIHEASNMLSRAASRDRSPPLSAAICQSSQWHQRQTVGKRCSVQGAVCFNGMGNASMPVIAVTCDGTPSVNAGRGSPHPASARHGLTPACARHRVDNHRYVGGFRAGSGGSRMAISGKRDCRTLVSDISASGYPGLSPATPRLSPHPAPSRAKRDHPVTT